MQSAVQAAAAEMVALQISALRCRAAAPLLPLRAINGVGGCWPLVCGRTCIRARRPGSTSRSRVPAANVWSRCRDRPTCRDAPGLCLRSRQMCSQRRLDRYDRSSHLLGVAWVADLLGRRSGWLLAAGRGGQQGQQGQCCCSTEQPPRPPCHRTPQRLAFGKHVPAGICAGRDL